MLALFEICWNYLEKTEGKYSQVSSVDSYTTKNTFIKKFNNI